MLDAGGAVLLQSPSSAGLKTGRDSQNCETCQECPRYPCSTAEGVKPARASQSHAGAKVEGRMMNEEMPVKATQCYPKTTSVRHQSHPSATPMRPQSHHGGKAECRMMNAELGPKPPGGKVRVRDAARGVLNGQFAGCLIPVGCPILGGGVCHKQPTGT